MTAFITVAIIGAILLIAGGVTISLARSDTGQAIGSTLMIAGVLAYGVLLISIP